MHTGKVIVVMPAYNAAATIAQTCRDLPPDSVDEVIVVDDASTDDTVAVARELALTVYTHDRNYGYGRNQKSCYSLAREHGADYVVMIHPDEQYDARLLSVAVDILRLGVCDVVLGNRVRTRRECLAGGMPRYKYLANRALTLLANVVLGQNLGEWHSGFRAYRRAVLETVPWERNSDNFVFDTQFLLQAVHFGFIIGDVPMPVRYHERASSISFWRSVWYGLSSLAMLCRTVLHRWRLARSAFLLPRGDGAPGPLPPV
jgi:glycosyltransferase involved in cell wall biosynthesis